MSRFYGSIQGNRGGATRQGTPASGMEGHIRGWDIGGRVIMSVNPATGRDTCTIYLTSGSNGYGHHQLLGDFEYHKSEDPSKPSKLVRT